MPEFWTNYGIYLWAFTTALVIIALIWLAWSTFGQPAEGAPDQEDGENQAQNLELQEQVTNLAAAMPYMQGTLGRTLQYRGLKHYSDAMGAQAFALAVANARGDGFVLASSVRGGLTAKLLANWACSQALTAEEQSAVEQAQAQIGTTV